MKNKEDKLITNFGKEWTVFNQEQILYNDNYSIFKKYFKILPDSFINKHSVVLDAGCGSGRWSYFIAPKVKTLYCLEPSTAIEVAKSNLKKFNNLIFINNKIENIDIKNNSIDFCFCLGVLHHTLDVEKNLKKLVEKLKSGSPILLYLYYNFENRNLLFRSIWMISNILRLMISRLPFTLKIMITNFLAIFIYFPISRISKLFDIFGFNSKFFPLSIYKDLPLSILKNDSLDRFGTTIEKRFSKKQITKIMSNCNLKNIKFSDSEPYWSVIGYKK